MQISFSHKTVLLTGAAGFLGSHLADALLKAGAKVIGVDNFLTGRQENIAHLQNNPNWQFIQADVIADPTSYLPAEFLKTKNSADNGQSNGKNNGQNLDYIFHFASPASPPRYQAHPKETYRVNAMATDLLLSFIQKYHPQAKFIFASTSEIYGDPQIHPQTEDYWGNVNPNGIRSCYDEAKRLGETICGVFQRDCVIDVRILRIFNTYGERMDPTDGRVIPNFVTQALQGKKMTIYGNGKQTRSYCYVADLIAGILAFASHPGCNGQTINLGNPTEFSVLETAKLVYKQVAKLKFKNQAGNSNNQAQAPNFESQIIFKPLPGDDPTRRRPDISKAKNLLAWEPKVSFKEGLKKTVEYFSVLVNKPGAK